MPQRVARAALGALGRGGSLVLVSSQLARIGAPGYASYCAAKGGIDALVRALAVDVGPDGIRVNAVAPGLVRTPMAYVGRDNFDELVPAHRGAPPAAPHRRSPTTSPGRWRSCSRTRRRS